jgi:hypothetical protein
VRVGRGVRVYRVRVPGEGRTGSSALSSEGEGEQEKKEGARKTKQYCWSNNEKIVDSSK